MRIERRRRPRGVVCFVLLLLIGCGGSAGGRADGGTGRAARDVGSGTAEAWVGRASGIIGGALVDGLETEAELTWVALPDQPVPGQTVYSAQGRVSYRGASCAVTPAEASIEAHSDARMVIDWTRSPPEYAASGASTWIASVSCGDAPVDAPVGGVWLADPSTIDQAARGALTDETTIEGSATFGDPRAVEITFHWAFRKAN
jgi:hypothetical protein